MSGLYVKIYGSQRIVPSLQAGLQAILRNNKIRECCDTCDTIEASLHRFEELASLAIAETDYEVAFLTVTSKVASASWMAEARRLCDR